MAETPSAADASRTVVLVAILSTVAFSFVGFLNIGMALAVLPRFVHEQLGFTPLVAGLAVSAQYLATLLSRPHVGRFCDTLGPRTTVLGGLAACALSGVFMLFGGLAQGWPAASLGLILPGRLALGCAESSISTGAIAWGLGQVGHRHTARVISWNGVATYGALAAGAPLGVFLAHRFGFVALGAATLLLMAAATPLALRKRATAVDGGERYPFRTVVRRVAAHGVGLALGSIGFGCIATFITLYFGDRGWGGAALALSLFGGAFVGTRFVFAWSIGWLGGYRVAMVSFAVETIGLLMLWQAAGAGMAMAAAAVVGLGFSLVFPALGTEAVQRVPAHSRGTALGVYGVFFDVALAAIGPLGGWAAAGLGYAGVYGIAALAAVAGALLTLSLHLRR